MPNSCRVMRRPNRYFDEDSVVGMVMERGAAVRRVADDGMPEPGRIRRRLRVTCNWHERRRHVVDSLLGRTEELELGSAGTGIMALLGVVLIVAAVPLVGTTLLTSVPTGTGVGAGRRGARRRSRWNPDPRASAQDCCPGPG